LTDQEKEERRKEREKKKEEEKVKRLADQEKEEREKKKEKEGEVEKEVEKEEVPTIERAGSQVFGPNEREEGGERLRIAMILKQRQEKRRKEVKILRDERRNLCKICLKICPEGKRVCGSRECRRKSLLTSSLSPMKTRKCLAQGCQNILSTSHHGNFCRSRSCVENREKDKMAFTRRVSAPLLPEEEEDAEKMEAEFREEMREERDRKELEEMIRIFQDEFIRDKHPESHASVVHSCSSDLLKTLSHLQTCCPKSICFNCGIWLFASDLHWANTETLGLSRPYPAESNFHYIPDVVDLIKEKIRRKSGNLLHFVSSCGYCVTNCSKEFFLEDLERPEELQGLTWKEEEAVSLVRFNCFLTRPAGKVSFVHSTGNKSLGKKDLDGLFGLLHLPASNVQQEKVKTAMRYLKEKNPLFLKYLAFAETIPSHFHSSISSSGLDPFPTSQRGATVPVSTPSGPSSSNETPSTSYLIGDFRKLTPFLALNQEKTKQTNKQTYIHTYIHT